MYGFLLAILFVDGLFMTVVVLLQAGKGGGLASVGGGAAMTEGILGGRQATTVLTRATWVSGSIFMALALVLSIMSSRSSGPQSVIQVQTPTTTAPQPVLPGVGGEGAGAAAPAPVGTPSAPTGN
ncbi:MAG: preprotein translocase subunit SecG [Gemmatimonadetes bacterium]|nr:preprotein translocase subunit SecG [Gemmatimonadota bacterium]